MPGLTLVRHATFLGRRWAAASQERAVVNARVACTEASARRVEREEVALVVARLQARRPLSRREQHPA